jgi:hypothetical protein
MHRRALLAVAAGAATVGVLGTVADRPAAPPADHAADPVSRARSWDRPVVTSDVTTVGDEGYGTVTQRASILDLDPTGRYALVAAYELTPGSNYRAGSGWKTASLTVDHDWRAGASLADHRGDVVTTRSSDPTDGLYLETSRSTGRYRWRLSFDAPTENSRSYRFATVATLDEPPGPGDGVLDATVGGRFTKGFHASERDVASTRLVLPAADA